MDVGGSSRGTIAGFELPLNGVDMNNPLVGTWHLVRWEITYSDGREPTLPYGDDATGLIVYSADGWMNACICRSIRPRLSSDSLRSAPEAERLSACESFFQYAGRYEIEGALDRRHVVHSVTHALNPNFVGTRQVRLMSFGDDDHLTLSATDVVPGTTIDRHHTLAWSRQRKEFTGNGFASGRQASGS